MKVPIFPNRSASIYRTTRCHIKDGRYLNFDRRENLKFYMETISI